MEVDLQLLAISKSMGKQPSVKPFGTVIERFLTMDV
jgi:hypothetical protein